MQSLCTAKNGFQNERDIVAKFKDWEYQEVAQRWLIALGYDINEIECNKEVLKAINNHFQIMAEIRAEEAYERRMGY